jgi:DNA-directed RNA polymerase specialized sigma24 family protein
MASCAGIIGERFLDLAASLNQAIGRFRNTGNNGQLSISLDSETRNLLTHFAEHSAMTPEEAAGHWLEMQASAHQKDRVVGQIWGTLSNREQQVVARCRLEYSDREITVMLGIAYGTARNHLFNAIRKLGIQKNRNCCFC